MNKSLYFYFKYHILMEDSFCMAVSTAMQKHVCASQLEQAVKCVCANCPNRVTLFTQFGHYKRSPPDHYSSSRNWVNIESKVVWEFFVKLWFISFVILCVVIYKEEFSLRSPLLVWVYSQQLMASLVACSLLIFSKRLQISFWKNGRWPCSIFFSQVP